MRPTMGYARRLGRVRNHLPSRWCGVLSILWWCAPAAWALDPRLSLSQYIHTNWLQNEGAPLPAVNAITQTADGYLWLGTSQGLWKFDGLRFTRWTVPAN